MRSLIEFFRYNVGLPEDWALPATIVFIFLLSSIAIGVLLRLILRGQKTETVDLRPKVERFLNSKHANSLAALCLQAGTGENDHDGYERAQRLWANMGFPTLAFLLGLLSYEKAEDRQNAQEALQAFFDWVESRVEKHLQPV